MAENKTSNKATEMQNVAAVDEQASKRLAYKLEQQRQHTDRALKLHRLAGLLTAKRGTIEAAATILASIMVQNMLDNTEWDDKSLSVDRYTRSIDNATKEAANMLKRFENTVRTILSDARDTAVTSSNMTGTGQPFAAVGMAVLASKILNKKGQQTEIGNTAMLTAATAMAQMDAVCKEANIANPFREQAEQTEQK